MTTSEPAIRRADEQDAHVLSGLGAKTFSDAFAHLYRRQDLAAFLRDHHSPAFYDAWLSNSETASWVAESADGALIAYCTAGPCTLPAPDLRPWSGELCRLYVDEKAQGGGLGKTLLETALGWLERRFDDLYVGVYSENFGAQRLYRQYGFCKIAEYHFMVGSHPDLEWIMKRGAREG